MGHPRPLFYLFSSFSNNFQNKTVDFSGIRTRVVWLEGEHADHADHHHHGLRANHFLSLHSLLSFRHFTENNDNLLPISDRRQLHSTLNVGSFLNFLRYKVVPFHIEFLSLLLLHPWSFLVEVYKGSCLPKSKTNWLLCPSSLFWYFMGKRNCLRHHHLS